MKYLVHNGHQLATKNKLQSAVQNYLQSIDRTYLANNTELRAFKKSVMEDIESFNLAHHRCNPIKPHWWESSKNDHHLGAVSFCNFHIYHSKTDFKNPEAS